MQSQKLLLPLFLFLSSSALRVGGDRAAVQTAAWAGLVAEEGGSGGDKSPRKGSAAGAREALLVEGAFSRAYLKTSNGCGTGNFLIPCSGDTAPGSRPLLGVLEYSGPGYAFKVLDTLHGTQVLGVSFTCDPWWGNSSMVSAYDSLSPYVVVTDSGMFSYAIDDRLSPYLDTIRKLDSLFIPGIRRKAKQVGCFKNFPVVLLVEDSADSYSLRFHSYPALQELFRSSFHTVPEIFEVTDTGLFITGRDSAGAYLLYHYSTGQDTLYRAYTLNDSAANAQEFLITGDTLYILSSPGDSITVLTAVNKNDGNLVQDVIYAKSGARATHNEYQFYSYFTFQPVADSPDSVLDRHIQVLEPAGRKVTTFQADRQLRYFKYAQEEGGGFAYFSLSWIGAGRAAGKDTVHIGQGIGDIRVATAPYPDFINASFGCTGSLAEDEADKIHFEVHPNPAASEVTISLSGLEKKRIYKLTISDASGRIHYTTQIEAYRQIRIPLQELARGIYFLNLDTGRNLISRKLILRD